MEYEYVIMQKSGVKIYNIPPLTSNKGHFLDSWKNKINEVNLKVVGKGHSCIIHLVNYDGTPFASAPVPENYELGVVRCEDSSRGYALKLVDPAGKSAWVGAIFAERNHSFDFIAALQDFAKNRDMEVNPEKYAAENKPTQNFALKKGEKISFNVGADAQNKPKPSGGNTAFKLAPPPGGNNFGLPAPSNDFKSFQQKQQTQSSNSSQPFTGFSDNNNNNQFFGGSTNQNTQQNQNSFGQFNFSGGQQNSSQPSNTNNNNNAGDTFDLL